MQVIAHAPVGAGGISAIEFNVIPSTYKDLLVLFSIRLSNNNIATLRESFGIRINGSGGASRYLYGTGSSSTSGTLSANDYWIGEVNSSTSTSSTFANGKLYVHNYNSSNQKSLNAELVFENNATEAWQFITGGYSSSSAAVTSIELRNFGGEANIPILEGSSATLYGITAGSDGVTTVS